MTMPAADDAEGIPAAAGDQPAPVGEALEVLLDRLNDAGLVVGPRERIAVGALTAELLSRGAVGGLRDLRPHLAPLLARTPAEIERFRDIFDALTLPPKPYIPTPLPPEKPVNWRRRAAWVMVGLLMVAAVAVGWRIIVHSGLDDSAQVPIGDAGHAVDPPPRPPDAKVSGPTERSDVLKRVAAAAGRYGGAPTLEELARVLAPQAEGAGDPHAWQTTAVLRGHTETIWSVAASKDGELVVTGSNDNTARVWNGRTGQLIRVLTGHSDWVQAVATSPDAGFIVTGSGDRTVRVWDSATGAQRLVINVGDAVGGFVVTPDGRFIVTGDWGGNVRVWDAVTGVERKGPNFESPNNRSINAVAISPDGKFLVAGNDDNTANVWDWTSGKLLFTLSGHTERVQAVAISPDSRWIATASWDDTARLWDAQNGDLKHTFPGSESVWTVAFTPDGRELVRGNTDDANIGIITFSDVTTGTRLSKLNRESDSYTNGLAFSADGRLMVTGNGSGDDTVRLWRLRPGIGWTAAAYAAGLQHLTGLPSGTPLPVFGLGARDSALWATLAQGVERLEFPQSPLTYDHLTKAADAGMDDLATPNLDPTLYDIATTLPTWFPGGACPHAGTTATATGQCLPRDKGEAIAAIQTAWFCRFKAPAAECAPSPEERVDAFTVERALALTTDLKLWRNPGDADWRGLAVTPETVPWWLPWAVLTLPLIAVIVWFGYQLSLRKAYLRRRPPDLPPLHHDLISQTDTRFAQSAGKLRQILQKLLIRTSLPSAALDVEATIAATLAGGGERLEPVYAEVRHMPEYLVLIERRSVADQEAARLRELVQRLHGSVPFVVFYYQELPEWLQPEDGGRAQPIQRVQATFPHHRLLVFGSGAAFLDDRTGRPRRPVEALAQWERRVLLTATPLAEWGRREFTLAHALNLPIGRATPDGLLAAADLLGREQVDESTEPDAAGDGLARPLPELLRLSPDAVLYNAAPSDLTPEQLVLALRNMLDGPGFDWLCALAVYPAIQWDLTLYLGVNMAERAGGDLQHGRLYDDARLANLTRLPWLREGEMPNWVRRALIAELPRARGDEIRAVLYRLIQSAKLTGDAERDEVIKLRIAQEPSKERLAPEALFEDEVLLDFMARGRLEDLPMPKAGWLETLLHRTWLDRIGIPALGIMTAVAAYAVTAFRVVPDPAAGPPVTGAWLPLMLLFAGAMLASAIGFPQAAYRVIRTVWVRAAPALLAVSLTAGAVVGLEWASTWILAKSRFSLPSWLFSPPATIIGLFAIGAVCLWLARRAADRVYLPLHLPDSSRLRWSLLLSARLTALAAVGGLALQTWWQRMTVVIADVPVPAALLVSSCGVVVFALAVALQRWTPEALTINWRFTQGRPAWNAVARLTGVVQFILCLLPLPPSLWLHDAVERANVRLPSSALGTTAYTETSDGRFFALGGADGSVRVFDAARPAAALTTTDGKERGGALAAVSRLAQFAQAAGSSPRVAAAYADGTVRLFDGETPTTDPAYDWVKNIRSVGNAALPAFADNGDLALVVQNADGTGTLTVNGKPVAPFDKCTLPTALAALQGGAFMASSLDGGLRVYRSDAVVSPATVVAPLDGVKLGWARRIDIDNNNKLHVVGHDGEGAVADVENGHIINLHQKAAAPALRLGGRISCGGDK